MSLEQFKEPPMMMASASMIAIAFSTYYFHNITESLKKDIGEIAQGLSGIAQKVAELSKDDQNKTEAVVALDKQIKVLNEKINAFPSMEYVENMSGDVSEIMEVLSNNDLLPERRSGNPGARKPSVTTKPQPRYYNNPNRYEPAPQKQQTKPAYEDDYSDLVQAVRSQTTPPN